MQGFLARHLEMLKRGVPGSPKLGKRFWQSPISTCLCLLLLLTLSACASLRVADTQPLSQAELEPLGAEHISKVGYRLESLPTDPEAPDLLILVAISGGGKRSASFGYGALSGMRDLMVPTRSGPRPLLDEVDGISGVSGGSFPAAYYGLYREKTFDQFKKDFLYDDTESYIYGIYLLPWNWTWLVDPSVGTNDFMDRVYDKTMFHGATFGDLEARGRPVIAITATDISYGTPFMFTQAEFDLICSDLSVFPISRAVAASNGFPGLFTPVTLTNHTKDCGGRKPDWLNHITDAALNDPMSRAGLQGRRAERYLDGRKTEYLHLVDGGVSDNLAMRGAGSFMQVMPVEQLRDLGYLPVRRLLVLSIDGQGTQDSSVARKKMVGGLLSVLSLVSGAQIDSYNFETLTLINEQVQAIAQRLRDGRCASGPIVDGGRCDDVRAALVRISLAEMPETPEKEKLLAIPTGLTIPPEDVDLLVKAGHDAIMNSPELRSFLDSYQPAPSPTQTPGTPPRVVAATYPPARRNAP